MSEWVPSWLKYKKVDLDHKLKASYELSDPATTFLDDLFGPHYLSAGIGVNRLLPYLPKILHEIGEFVALTESESVELYNLEASIQQLLDDQFVASAGINSIKRRERMFGIQADPKELLDFRKKRILNRYRIKPPFTVRYLQQQLDNLVGPGMTIVSVDVQNFILYVTANIDDAAVFREVQRMVEAVKPANLVYQQNTSLNSVIGLKEHISKQTITWNYKLDDTWKLGEKPFASLGSEEVIK